MLVVLSPAKSLDLESDVSQVQVTRPRHAARAVDLVKVQPDNSLSQLSDLMGISSELAALNAKRYAEFRERPRTTTLRPAALMFAGDVYRGLDAWSLSPAELEQTQRRVRILSGLYGDLRPLDGIQPYRLEMGTKLVTDRGSTLYDYWGDQVTNDLRRDLGAGGVLVNLASKEYFSVVDVSRLRRRVVTCEFTDESPTGAFRIVSFFAKRARGLMARYVVTEQINHPDDLRGFDLEGYAYAPGESTADRLVFQRTRAAKQRADETQNSD